MNKNNRETEIKIKISNLEDLEKKIISLSGEKLSEGKESDVTFNDDAGNFSAGNDKGRHLRLRKSSHGNFLTYKESLEEKRKDYILDRIEIETRVSDYEKTKSILEKLGYKENNKKEKQYRKYKLDGLIVEFHKMPFLGDFIEIEGSENDIKNILGKIGFRFEDGINKGYFVLFQEYLKKHNLPESTPFTFEEEKKHHLQK